MIRVDAGGMTRRSFVQLGIAGLTSGGLPQLLRARDESGQGKDTRVLMLWLEGGPSHMDLWDMKPDAPAEYRGYWRPIGTSVPGLRITEMFPRQAKMADKFSIIRSLCHGEADHFAASRAMITGRAEGRLSNAGNRLNKYPSIGSIASKVIGPRRRALPAYVTVPKAGDAGLVNSTFGAAYLGPACDPFETGGDPNRREFKVHDLSLAPGMSVERLDDRRGLRRSLDTMRRGMERSGMLDSMDHFEQEAYELVSSPAVARAFDIAGETEELRDRYGRTTWGQSILLARRLVEAGVTFVTASLVGWDQHNFLKERMEDYLPRIDAALSTLFEDLSSRGLFEKVLVIVCGEMSRAPRMSQGEAGKPPGRDHWTSAISLVLGGGGVKGGRVVGATDSKGETIVDRPLTPGDLHATINHVLGIDPSTSFVDSQGRPVAAVEAGAAIRELI